MIIKMLKKKIKNLVIDKFKLEVVKKKLNNGIAWISSKDYYSIQQLIKLHYTIYAGYRIRTYIIGYAYDSLEDYYEEDQ